LQYAHSVSRPKGQSSRGRRSLVTKPLTATNHYLAAPSPTTTNGAHWLGCASERLPFVAKASRVFNVAQVDGYSIPEALPPLPPL
jgi:hypothetical protein